SAASDCSAWPFSIESRPLLLLPSLCYRVPCCFPVLFPFARLRGPRLLSALGDLLQHLFLLAWRRDQLRKILGGFGVSLARQFEGACFGHLFLRPRNGDLFDRLPSYLY